MMPMPLMMLAAADYAACCCCAMLMPRCAHYADVLPQRDADMPRRHDVFSLPPMLPPIF